MQSNKYNTNQRDLILRFLLENKQKHITVDELQFHLKEKGNAVGKATIYRYFDLLVNEGNLRKYDASNGKSACYQYVEHSEHCHMHYHLICDSCEQLFHVECDHLDLLNTHLLENHNFELNCFTTIFHGICKKCTTQG